MKFDSGRGLRGRRVNIWGEGGLFEQKLNANAATPEKAPMSIIGGQFVSSDDPTAINEASNGLRDRFKTGQATQQMRQTEGSPTLSPSVLAPGRGRGLAATAATTAGDGPGPMPDFSISPDSDIMSPDMNFGIAAYEDMGFRNGGMFTKRKMVKQPGYKGGGKVTMPEEKDPRTPLEIEAQERVQQALQSAEEGGEMHRPSKAYPQKPAAKPPGYKWGPQPRDGYRWDDEKGMRGMMVGGSIGDGDEDDGKDSVEVRVREGEYLLNPPTVAKAFGGGDYNSGVKNLDQIVRSATGKEPGPVPVDEDGEEVDDYEENIEYAQGMRCGGKAKMGYAPGGPVQLDMFGNPVNPSELPNRWFKHRPVAEIPAAPAPTTAAPAPAAAPKASRLSGMRAAISGKNTTTVGDLVKGVGRGTARGVRAVGGGAGLLRGAAPAAGIMGGWQGLNTPTEDYAARMGIDYPETGLGELGVRTAGVLSDVGTAFIDPFIELGNLATGGDVPTLRSNFADVEAAGGTGASLPAQLAGASAAAPAPVTIDNGTGQPVNPYGRAFGAGAVNGLRNPDTLYAADQAVPVGQQRIVQRTGGPGNEAIIREDVNGVPTFTNVRQGGFDGSAANLQAQADRRAQEDMAIRAQQGQVVEQMRQNAPIYTAEGVAARQAADAEREANRLDAASRKTPMKPLDLRKELEQQFQQDVVDEDGQVTKRIPNQGQIQMFESIISQLNPAIMAEYGVPFDQLPVDKRMEIYTGYGDVLNDTMAAVKAQEAQGYPTSDVPRTGRNGLRVLPGSDISFLGDAVFGDATLGEYWAGVGDGQGTINDLMVTDPASNNQTRIPLQRLMRANRKDEQGALQRYRYFDGETQ